MTPLRVAAAHAVDLSSVLALSCTWVVVLAVNGLSLPAIDPSPEAISRPLESVTTIALALPIAVAIHLSSNRLAWLAHTSPRSVVLGDIAWFAAIYLVQWVGLAVVAVAAPGVPGVHLFAVHTLLLALALLAARTAGPLAGVCTPLVLIAVLSVPDLVPWPANLIYNLDQATILRFATLVGVPALTAVAVQFDQKPAD